MKNAQKGFTIVELLISSLVFSVILLLVSYGLIYISKSYYKSVAQSQAQETARSVIENVSQAIQFNGGSVSGELTSGSDPERAYCVGSRRYTFIPENQVVTGSASGRAFYADKVTGTCADPQSLSVALPSVPDGKELLPEGMMLHEFSISKESDTLYKVIVHLVILPPNESFPSDIFDSSTGNCISGPGSEFCAASRLETVVEKRIL